MMLNLLVLCFCLLNLILIINNIGDGMTELRRWDRAIQEVETVKVEAEEACEKIFDFSFDIDSFVSQTDLSELDNKGMNSYCGDAFAAMSDVCAYSDYYGSMANVKSVSCAFDKQISLAETTLEDGHLRFAFNWDTTSHGKTVSDYLLRYSIDDHLSELEMPSTSP